MATKTPVKTVKKIVAKPAAKKAPVKTAATKVPAKKIVAKKATADMTPLEKARLARANGTAKAKAKRKPGVVFKAPDDMKPFFIKLQGRWDRDGLLTDLKAVRIKGSLTNENAKTADIGLYDPDTMRKLVARFAGPVWIRSEAKRLPAGSIALMAVRIAVNRDTRALGASFKSIKLKVGDAKPKLLAKTDPYYRAIRKSSKFLAPAFTKALPFPSAADLKALTKAQEE